MESYGVAEPDPTAATSPKVAKSPVLQRLQTLHGQVIELVVDEASRGVLGTGSLRELPESEPEPLIGCQWCRGRRPPGGDFQTPSPTGLPLRGPARSEETPDNILGAREMLLLTPSRHAELLGQPRVLALPLLELGALGGDLLKGATREEHRGRGERLPEVDDRAAGFVVVVVADCPRVLAAEDQHRPVLTTVYQLDPARSCWETKGPKWETEHTGMLLNYASFLVGRRRLELRTR